MPRLIRQIERFGRLVAGGGTRRFQRSLLSLTRTSSATPASAPAPGPIFVFAMASPGSVLGRRNLIATIVERLETCVRCLGVQFCSRFAALRRARSIRTLDSLGSIDPLRSLRWLGPLQTCRRRGTCECRRDGGRRARRLCRCRRWRTCHLWRRRWPGGRGNHGGVEPKIARQARPVGRRPLWLWCGGFRRWPQWRRRGRLWFGGHRRDRIDT